MKGIKFRGNNPAIHKNSHDFMMWDLRREFEKLLLLQAVVESYSKPCDLTKQRIYRSN